MPFPIPLAPEVIVSHGMSKDLEAVHEQVAPVVTLTLSVPPFASKFLLVGSIENAQGVTTVAVIASETAFWHDESSANPDKEIIAAVRPSLFLQSIRQAFHRRLSSLGFSYIVNGGHGADEDLSGGERRNGRLDLRRAGWQRTT